MNRFTEHIPASCGPDGQDIPPRGFDFEATTDLVSHPLVAMHASPCWHGSDVAFSHFAKSKHLLMMVGDRNGAPGGYWWVIGFLKDPGAVDLPEWRKP